MLHRLTSLLSLPRSPQSAPSRERIDVAVAVVLLEMAHADKNFEPLERTLVEGLMQEKFGLDPAAAKDLLTLAEGVRSDSFDLQQFTRQINQNFNRAEKLEVMETLWRIVYADGVLDKYEDALARQLAALLRLSHREAIELKLKVLDEQRSGT
jgi:uncharacterized tellurite resistance protein B-like protein